MALCGHHAGAPRGLPTAQGAQSSLPPAVEVQLQLLSLCVCVCVSGDLPPSSLVGLLRVPKTDILAKVHRRLL